MPNEGSSLPRELIEGLADRYRIERELGAGGMAIVFLARDVRHDRDVAVKVLHPELGAAIGGERFLAEIKTTAKLQHPHILPLLDSGQAGSFLYYVMPFVAGETLRSRLEREGQLPIEDVLRIAREVADALGAAHALGIVHRDIKPENILLQGGHALVADFGIALAVQQAGGARMTQTGLSLGTPQYMSPEQAMGEKQVDLRADIYALGAVTYEMLVGDPPFTGSSVQAIIAKAMTERPTPPSTVRDTVPPALEASVLRALAKLPADRFSSAQAFANALTTGAPIPVVAAATVHPGSAGAQRAVRIWQAITALALIAAAFAFFRPRPRDEHLILQRQLTYVRNAIDVAISPDGLWIAYLQDDCALAQLARCTYTLNVREVDGSQGIRIATWASIAPDIHWSGGGESVVFRGSEQGGAERVFISGRLGGSLRQLSLSPTAMTVMPDGRTLVASTGPPSQQRLERWDLSTLALVDSAPLPPFVAVDGLSASPRDGALAAYASMGGNRSVVMLLSADARIVDTLSVPARSVVRWDPAGTALLIFDDGEAGAPGDDLLRIPVTGGQFNHHAPPTVVLGQVPSSADGRLDVARSGRVVVVAATGEYFPMIRTLSGAETQWRAVPGGMRYFYGRVRFSPDGRWLIGGSSDNIAENLYLVRIDSGALRAFTAYRGWNAAGGRWAQDAEYSPEGRRILFTRGNGRGADFVIMDSSGGGERILAPAKLGTHAQWLDEAHAVVFRNGSFVVLDTLGVARDSLRVPDTLEVVQVRAHQGERSVYFTSGTSIAAADFRTHSVRRVISAPMRVVTVGWLPDGALLVSNARRARDGMVFRVDRSGALQPFLALPHGCLNATLNRDGSMMFCQVNVPQGDVWLAAKGPNGPAAKAP